MEEALPAALAIGDFFECHHGTLRSADRRGRRLQQGRPGSCGQYLQATALDSIRQMTAEVKSAVGAARLLLAAVGTVTTLAGLINSSVVVALNSIGVVGVGALVVGGVFYSGADSAGSPAERAKTALLAMGVASVIFGAVFLLGRPLDESEKQPGLLTVIGVAYLFFAAFLAVSAGPLLGPKQKACPDCANKVLVEARKCEHCGYRFDATTS